MSALARPRSALVVTTIQAPTTALLELAAGSIDHDVNLIVVGDRMTPAHFELPGCRYCSLEEQLAGDSGLARRLPVGHYARKNLGYLIAIKDGADVILETDDDNFPYAHFWAAATPDIEAPVSEHGGWVNAYRYFLEDDTDIWPRGFPWDELHRPVPPLAGLPRRSVHCPVQQGLADHDPDVDAIWRLTRGGHVTFSRGPAIALGSGSWCPFNSQNTRWFKPAFPLLYLPASCNMRLADIWRSFVAQRIMWANGWLLLVHEPTMRQARNPHDLRTDVIAEFTGYARNAEIARRLMALDLAPGCPGDAMMRCYDLFVSMGLLASWELDCLTAWLAELPS